MHLSILSSGFRYFFGLHPSSLDSSIPLSLCGCSLAEQEHLERVETYFYFTLVVTSPAYFFPLLKISLSMQNVKSEIVQERKVQAHPWEGFFCWIHVVYPDCRLEETPGVRMKRLENYVKMVGVLLCSGEIPTTLNKLNSFHTFHLGLVTRPVFPFQDLSGHGR